MLGGNGGNITHCNNRIMLGGNGGNITHYSSCKNNILTFINKEIATIG